MTTHKKIETLEKCIDQIEKLTKSLKDQRDILLNEMEDGEEMTQNKLDDLLEFNLKLYSRLLAEANTIRTDYKKTQKIRI